MQYTLTALIEQKRDLPALANAGATEILIPLSGYSFTSAHKMNLQDALDLAASAHAFGMQAALLVNKIFAQEEVNMLDDLFATSLLCRSRRAGNRQGSPYGKQAHL